MSGKIKTLTKLYPYLWPKDWGIWVRFLIAGILLLAAIALNIGAPLVLREVINAIPMLPLYNAHPDGFFISK